MTLSFQTPSGKSNNLCMDILKQPHTLIAGATGSGKSVLINAIIYNALYFFPSEKQLILIDPKRVELVKYKGLPHAINYSSEPDQIIQAIGKTVDLMERRYKTMQKRKIVKSTEPHAYIIVDEFADLMTTCKKETLKPLCRIAQLGRAANIHLILATQRPTSDIINGQIKVNIDSRIALRCPTARDSVNIINAKGAESLPRYGQAYFSTPDGLSLVNIPFVPDEELTARVQWWEKQHPIYNRFFRERL